MLIKTLLIRKRKVLNFKKVEGITNSLKKNQREVSQLQLNIIDVRSCLAVTGTLFIPPNVVSKLNL